MRREAAFSLVEVMVATLILGVALVGLTQGMTTALSSSKDSELQTGAALMAAGQIEELRAEGFIEDGVVEGEGREGLSRYRWKRTVSPTDLEGLHEVTVEISQGESAAPLYELRTLVFEPPLLSSSSNTQRDRRRREGARR